MTMPTSRDMELFDWFVITLVFVSCFSLIVLEMKRRRKGTP